MDQELFSRYPVLLKVRRLLHLPVPVCLRQVEFIDAVSVQEEVALLLTRLQQYAEDMKKQNNEEELKHVLDRWAVDNECSFFRSTETISSVRLWHQEEDRCDILLGDAIQTCRELAKEELHMQQRPACKTTSTPEQVRRVLYVLQRDLLASPVAGMILEKKSLRDRFYCDGKSFPAYNYDLTGPAVGPLEKLLILIFAGGLLVVMLGYILIFAAFHPSQLQRAWLYSLYLWVGFDCILISSCEVLLQQVLIPTIIQADMRQVTALVMELIPQYTEKVRLDNIIRTAMTDPVQVHNGKSVEVPEEQPEERRIHNITDLFFVSARIAEHDFDTAQSRFLHYYSTMLPPGDIFSRRRWYRPLNPSLERATKKFKNPTLFTKTLGNGYRTIFHLDLIGKILSGVLVYYIYSPIWLQDLLLQWVLVVGLGILGVLGLALYKVNGILIVIPFIILLVTFLVYRFFDCLRRTCIFLIGASNRVRPSSGLPLHSSDQLVLNSSNAIKGSVKKSTASHRPMPVDLVNVVDVEAAHAFPMQTSVVGVGGSGKSGGLGVVSGSVTTVPLGSQVAPLSPDRPPKQLPQQSSPHPRKDSEFFADSEGEVTEAGADGDAGVGENADAAWVIRPVEDKLDNESDLAAAVSMENKDYGSDQPVQSDTILETKSPSPHASADPPAATPTNEHNEVDEFQEQRSSRELGSNTIAQSIASAAAAGVGGGDDDATESNKRDNINSGDEGGDEWESSHSDEDLFDLPKASMKRVMRSISADTGADASNYDSVGVKVDRWAGSDASPNANATHKPSLKMQTFIGGSGISSVTSSPVKPPSAASPTSSILPMALVARTVESEEDDSDYEEYGSDDVSRESFDDPLEQMG
eukprot:CAMPEP_0170370690 /NCGR_PEP_ID=MMETSP0117_2-20130122/8641_1 /TAXON_ID=400756 /ORGANISM="Durinskia baltica, Strain CSIRO CS-38" /LENGTH=865 /DNA_ID=CAMNT_0010625473 /DNA_START=8 /DNA_END=2605 /DNA_ORIENTATION=-